MVPQMNNSDADIVQSLPIKSHKRERITFNPNTNNNAIHHSFS